MNNSAEGENLAETSGSLNNFTMPKEAVKEAVPSANYSLFTDEKGATPDQDGGHRQNILDANHNYIGIGYDPTSGMVAEDFSDVPTTQD